MSVLNSILDIAKGDIIEKKNLGRFLPHVMIVAVAFCIFMGAQYIIEKTLIEKEKAVDALEETMLRHSQKNIELVSLGRMSTVEKMLQENNINIGRAEKPAQYVEKY